MFFRRLLPVARTGRQYMWLVARGKKDLPVWYPFRRGRGSFWDEPDFFKHFDGRMREQLRAANRMWPSFAEDARERMQATHGANAEVVEARIDSEGLYIKLNVSHYEPEELNVKLMNDRLTIAAKHEQKSDEHGFVSREFVREFTLPEAVDQDTIASRLTEDGHLIISAKVQKEAHSRTINIERGNGDKAPGESGNKKKEE